MRYNAAPWTFRPLLNVLKGIWRSDQPQAVYIQKSIQEPGTIKFLYYWLKQSDKMAQTKVILKLVDFTEPLMNDLIKQMNIDPKTIEYDNSAIQIGFDMLQGIDMKKSYEEYMNKYDKFA